MQALIKTNIIMIFVLFGIANAFMEVRVCKSSMQSSMLQRTQLRMAEDAPPATGKGPKRKLKDDVIQVNGRVVESLPNAMFRVEIEPSKQVILATISGKIRKNFVRIIVGDSVIVELSAYDLTRGRITYRNK